MLFSRFFRRSEMPPEEDVKPTPSAPPTSTTRPPADPGKPKADQSAVQDESENASELFAEMEEILGGSSDLVRIPCQALLSVLPEENRGEAYRADAIPENVFIELDRGELLEQLRRGRVVYPLETLADMLPAGWVRADSDTLVELNLPDVVEALPSGLLRGADQVDQDTIEAAQMRDYFKPGSIATETEKETKGKTPEPITARPPPKSASKPASKRPRPTPPPGAWNGIEKGRDASASTIDINHARVEDLERISGLGRVRAEQILAWRDAHGPLRGIYELADMPGVGRRLFQRMTGLNPAVTKRRDRHGVLNAWIGLPEDARPGLTDLIETIRSCLEVSLCVLADAQGLVLAASPKSNPDAHRLAALVPKMFRRIKRYVTRIAPGGEKVLVLPSAEKPLVLVRLKSYYLCATLRPESDWQEGASMLARMGTELEWLLGPRLVVYSPETKETA